MQKKKISFHDLQVALISTFQSYSWDTTDYDVWFGIREFVANRLWRALNGEELKKEGKLQKIPTKYKHIGLGFYRKVIK